jgi:hypothetical protein
MFKLIKFSIIILLMFNLFSVGALTVFSADPTPATEQPGTPLLPAPNGPKPDKGCDGTTNCGNYTLNDLMKIALTISQFILGIVGSLALLAFVAGGLMWLLSAGNPEWVTRGKQAIIGAVVGLAIVFTSFMIIQLVYSALGIEKAAGGKWAASDWFK